ncbi:MAG: 8-amino-7-oxononanoate synthase [Acidobacteria bacterium RIFCSPLOWO2_12_FULL_54_10]|nr:MAG: 8-amino-7-oxononanoate synthase [Acidobacteria bacterium RIFCSPLOWO2_12_FULL_54_10]
MSPVDQADQNDPQDMIRTHLAALKRAGLQRRLRHLGGAPGPRINVDGRSVLLLCSNNYLGLATDDRLKQAAQAAISTYGCGATGSRLISGNLEPYERLELDLAAFKGTESSLIFPSGYQANVGTVAALVGSRDVIFSDALNHASLIDGSRQSRAEMVTYNHCDPEDLEAKLKTHAAARRKLILTESVFSMDGDLAPLREICFLAKKYSALLLVDEAHATGIFGPNGAGLVSEYGLQPNVDIQMGTFSKALGSLGGYVAASREIIDYLLHRARSLIFSTGLPPAVLAASKAALQIVLEEPQRRLALWENVAHLRDGLARMGFDTSLSQSQILPVRLGDAQRTMAASRFLLHKGVFVQGVRPPTVPLGTARLRISPMAIHSEDDISTALTALESLQFALRQREKRLQQKSSLVPASENS